MHYASVLGLRTINIWGYFLSDCQVTVGLVSRRGRRGRPPKLTVTTEQQAQRRRDRLQEVRGEKDSKKYNGCKYIKKYVLFCLVSTSNTYCF